MKKRFDEFLARHLLHLGHLEDLENPSVLYRLDRLLVLEYPIHLEYLECLGYLEDLGHLFLHVLLEHPGYPVRLSDQLNLFRQCHLSDLEVLECLGILEALVHHGHLARQFRLSRLEDHEDHEDQFHLGHLGFLVCPMGLAI